MRFLRVSFIVVGLILSISEISTQATPPAKSHKVEDTKDEKLMEEELTNLEQKIKRKMAPVSRPEHGVGKVDHGKQSDAKTKADPPVREQPEKKLEMPSEKLSGSSAPSPR